jgi:Fe-S cluster assembly protein SufB
MEREHVVNFKDGGRCSYRGLIHVTPKAKKSKAFVSCDAMILDKKSRTDTYPTMKVRAKDTNVQHEATVERIDDEKLFYLESRGVAKQAARTLIINGFIDPIVKEIPLEYAIEMNRLISLEMEEGVG